MFAAADLPVPPGLVLAPFRAVRLARPNGPELAAATSPPYDVIDEAGVAALEASDAHNVVRLILPRDDGPEGSRYARSADTLAAWLAEGVLVRDEVPALYVYETEHDGHLQRGLVGGIGLADPDAQIVLPHENTMAGPVSDRLSLTRATRANLEPIFLVYDGGGPASRLVADAATNHPTVETTTDDGVKHRIWPISDPQALDTIAQDLLPRRAVIADGHHRYATYRHYQAERHAAGDGPGAWDFGLTFLVDATESGPEVHPIHRALRGMPPAEAARLAAGSFTVVQLELPADPTSANASMLEALAKAGQDGHAFVVTDGADAYLLTGPTQQLLTRALPADRSAAFRGLDVTVAHLALIVDVLGLEDAVGVVDYFHDVPAAVAAARASGGSALLLNSTPVGDVTSVAAAGERMPRKSTLFTPKPRTGLLIRLLDEQV